MTPAARQSVLALLIAATLTAATGGQLQLDAPALPQSLFNESIDSAEQQIAQIIKKSNSADKAHALVLDAQKNIRLIGRDLLIRSRDAFGRNEDGALAAHYGLTLLDGAGAIDELIADLPERVAEALHATPRDQQRIDQLKQAVDGLKAFNTLVADSTMQLKSLSEADIDSYLQRTIGPLAATAAALRQAPAATTWFSPRADPRPTPLTAQLLDTLGNSLAQLDPDPQSQQAIAGMIGRMKHGLDRPEYRPRVELLYDQLARLLGAAQQFTQAPWLDQTTRDEINQQVRTALLLGHDPSTRDAARSRTDRLVRMSELVATLNDLSRIEGLPMDNLRGLFMTAARLERDEKTQPTAAQIASIISRIAQAVLLQRGGEDAKLPLDIQRVKQVIQRSYVKQERELLSALAELIRQPQASTSPAWTSRVAQLHDLGVQVYYLNQVPDWVARMGKFNPHSARGLYKQLRQIAEDLLSAGSNQGAAAALAQINHQLALFEALPHEKPITTGDKAYAKFLADHHGAISQQVTLLRSQWAAAWGAGADPTPVGRNLLLLRRLFTAIHDTAGLEAQVDRLDSLNDWAAWRIAPQAIGPMRQWLADQLVHASSLAATGDWAQLSHTLDQIDHQAPVIWLAWSIAQRAPQVSKPRPSGVSSLLSQCLYSPSVGALGAAHRSQLASLCLYVTAADMQRRQGQAQLAQQLMDHAGSIAAQLSAQLPLQSPASAPQPGAAKPLGQIDL